MAPKRRGSANTIIGELNNPRITQVDQLAKIIQGYEEKNNATTEMMIEMRKMFDENLQALKKEKKSSKTKSWKI